jgi:hypothetical protein
MFIARRLTTIILCLCLLRSYGQDTLPKFQVVNSQGRIFVAFYNPYEFAKQVNIERSHDSTRNFTTINALSDPKQGTFTFTDVKAPNDHMYYRIFIQLQGASYTFTPSQLPVVVIQAPAVIRQAEAAAAAPRKKPEWEPSTHVFTDDYGNVRIDFPMTSGSKYMVRFYDDQHNFIFELPDIRERPLIVDKSNFLHAGWFNFELYENGVIQERNKFLLSKDN